MIGRNDLSSNADRITLIEHHVSQRNGQFANGRRINHIAIIENRDDPLLGFTNQDVVVVCVVVDNAESQTVPVDLLPFTEEALDQIAARVRQ